MSDDVLESARALLAGIDDRGLICADYTAEDDGQGGWYIMPPDFVGTIAKVRRDKGDLARLFAAAPEIIADMVERIAAIEASAAEARSEATHWRREAITLGWNAEKAEELLGAAFEAAAQAVEATDAPLACVIRAMTRADAQAAIPAYRRRMDL